MYQFRVMAHTQMGERIGLVGSTPELGAWDSRRCVPLQTSAQHYPAWWTARLEAGSVTDDADTDRIEYKYVRLSPDGRVTWEADGSNRWLPAHRAGSPAIIVEDGWFGVVQPWPFGYYETPPVEPLRPAPDGRTLVVVGSSVAAGFNAWLCHGWAWHLARAVEQRGDRLINAAEPGANVTTTLKRLPDVLAEHRPQIVIIALSLGNEGLAVCAPHERRAVQRRFESGLHSLVNLAAKAGAQPVLGGVYPNGRYTAEHAELLRATHARLQRGAAPLLDWLDALDNGGAQWQDGLWFDPAHPNTAGHRRMFEAIDLGLFDATGLARLLPADDETAGQCVYQDDAGFRLYASGRAGRVCVENASPHHYTMTPNWAELQHALQAQTRLEPGVYLADAPSPGAPASLTIDAHGALASTNAVPPTLRVEYRRALDFFTPERAEILYYDGQLGILRESDEAVRFLNETDHAYHVQPLWQEVREILRRLPPGVYADPDQPDEPLRTMMIGPTGLESRVKVPPRTAFRVRWQCALSDVRRIALLPLGNRCALRMLLSKLEYEGPCYPFDLTRALDTYAVADLVANKFEGMCTPEHLYYVHEDRRIYHTRIPGLSFAHEVEYGDDPINNAAAVCRRMQARYKSRADRFLYALTHCDEVVFMRTGLTDAHSAAYLRAKLAHLCGDKPFRLLLISPQSSDEFHHLPNVLHYGMEFNPDIMYDDLGYWWHCADVMRGILHWLGVSSRNLFWCPPKVSAKAAAAVPGLPGEPAGETSPWATGYESTTLSRVDGPAPESPAPEPAANDRPRPPQCRRGQPVRRSNPISRRRPRARPRPSNPRGG